MFKRQFSYAILFTASAINTSAIARDLPMGFSYFRFDARDYERPHKEGGRANNSGTDLDPRSSPAPSPPPQPVQSPPQHRPPPQHQPPVEDPAKIEARKLLVIDKLLDVRIIDKRHHEKNSRMLVEAFLDYGFSSSPASQATYADRIQAALKLATDIRDGHGLTPTQKEQAQNLQLRNAEYYLHGLYGIVGRDLHHASIAYLAPYYDGMKALTHLEVLAKLEEKTRTTKYPTSPPGGAPWARMGLRDGLLILNQPTPVRLDKHPLRLPELQEIRRGPINPPPPQ